MMECRAKAAEWPKTGRWTIVDRLPSGEGTPADYSGSHLSAETVADNIDEALAVMDRQGFIASEPPRFATRNYRPQNFHRPPSPTQKLPYATNRVAPLNFYVAPHHII
jgi:hypothetical protein